ncbi:hypothetical protein EVAR_51277_1 [Eumeta japonica]|uniref:Uncharacterized protein n=1 Tax=Eumeta variegata TaxID=151549 RepID=A0A4C1Y7Z6_EUMVA|nr:hypothetical protein EVAR_51277_1 [Eumeta japonica]
MHFDRRIGKRTGLHQIRPSEKQTKLKSTDVRESLPGLVPDGPNISGGHRFPCREIERSRLDCGDEVHHLPRLVPRRGETRTGIVCFSILNGYGGMDDKIDDVCELMKDRRLDILHVNETNRKSSGACRGEIAAALKLYSETYLGSQEPASPQLLLASLVSCRYQRQKRYVPEIRIEIGSKAMIKIESRKEMRNNEKEAISLRRKTESGQKAPITKITSKLRAKDKKSDQIKYPKNTWPTQKKKDKNRLNIALDTIESPATPASAAPRPLLRQ